MELSFRLGCFAFGLLIFDYDVRSHLEYWFGIMFNWKKTGVFVHLSRRDVDIMDGNAWPKLHVEKMEMGWK